MPTPDDTSYARLELIARHRAERVARRITGMLQATMGLEGQGLDQSTLDEMTARTVREILAKSRPA